MLRKALIIGFALIVALIGYNIYALVSGYGNLSNVPERQVMGAKDGDLSVIEFLDYRCQYCREAHSTITEAVRTDGRIRYIVRPIVYVDQFSLQAVRVMYAADQQEHFIEMHEILIKNKEDPTEKIIKTFVDELGLDWELFKSDMGSEGAKDLILQNRKLFAQVGGQSTPTFIIGHKIFYVPEGRMPEVSDFLDMFAEARGLGLR